MIQKIKRFILSAMLLLTVAAPVALPAGVAYASCGGIADQVANGAGSASNSTIDCSNTATSGNTTSAVGNLAAEVVTVFSYIVGAAAIVMIIYGGFRYITSGGDSGKVGSAKNTLIYAIVGLIVVALAQLLVHFVLSTATNTGANLAGSLY